MPTRVSPPRTRAVPVAMGQPIRTAFTVLSADPRLTTVVLLIWRVGSSFIRMKRWSLFFQPSLTPPPRTLLGFVWGLSGSGQAHGQRTH